MLLYAKKFSETDWKLSFEETCASWKQISITAKYPFFSMNKFYVYYLHVSFWYKKRPKRN